MRAQPSYIRTIKPNENRSSSEYNNKAILHQIKYLGLQENIRVRRAGFAYRNTFEKMIERFYLLSSATSYAGDYIWKGDAKSGCERILSDTGIAKEEWQMGVSKAFIKNPETVGPSAGDLAPRAEPAFSCLHWRQCAIATGIIWPLGSKGPGEITGGTRTSAPHASRGSGKTTRRGWRMLKFGSMVISFLPVGKSDGECRF